MAERLSIQIVTPAKRGSRAGNRVTATRWAGLLRSLGHTVRVVSEFRGDAADVLVALHARRSHESITRFRELFPHRPLVVALTGTDVYRDIHHDERARESLRLATALVVLQKAALDELPVESRGKGRVILQSAEPRRRKRRRSARVRIVSVGHLRAEKDPFRLPEALTLLPDLELEVLQAGAAIETEFEVAARNWMRREPRFRWLGELPAARARQLIADSDALVLTSVMEGGANVISEAVMAGVPVLSSRIPSSVALLGENYGGFFETGSAHELASLVRRFVSDPGFRQKLTRAVRRLQSKFTAAAERAAWQKLLREARISTPGLPSRTRSFRGSASRRPLVRGSTRRRRD